MTKEELLEEAIRRYPVGTKYIPKHVDPTDRIATIPENPDIRWCKDGRYIECGNISESYYTSLLYSEEWGGWSTITEQAEQVNNFIFSI